MNDVIIGGKIIIRNRELKLIDIQEVMAAVHRLAAVVASGAQS